MTMILLNLFLIYLDVRCSNKIISFNLVKRKISSNLKNFSDEALAEGNIGEDNNIDNSSQMGNNENQEIIEENNE